MMITTIEMQDEKNRLWKLVRNYTTETFDVYCDGSSEFVLEADDNNATNWIVFNHDPEADAYESREDYLADLASGTFEKPIIASREFRLGESLSSIMIWAIGQYRLGGWKLDYDMRLREAS